MSFIKKYALMIFVLFGFCAFIISEVIFDIAFIKKLDFIAYDSFLALNADERRTSDSTLIVDIDEKSLAQFGQWPWPRYLLGSLISKLAEANASVIALDILLNEKDRSSPARIKADLKKYFLADLDIATLPQDLQDNDINFANAISTAPVVLGAFAQIISNSGENSGGNSRENFTNIDENTSFPKPLGLAVKSAPNSATLENSILKAQILPPLKLFYEKASVGVVNAGFSSDGVLRSVPLLVLGKNGVYASLALRALMLAQGKNTLRLNMDADGVQSVAVGKLKTRLNSDASFNVVFGSSKYRYISASDVLDGKAGRLDGKIVFVGSSAPGLVDIRNTALNSSLAGVEVHANIVDNIIENKSIIEPKWSVGAQVLLVILLFLLSFVLFTFSSALLYLPAVCALLICVLFGSFWLFKEGFFLSPVPSVLALVLYGVAILSFRFYKEERAKKLIKSAFSRYLSPQLVAKIAQKGEVVLGGEQKVVSVLFSDIRGFTSISEKLSAHDMVGLLNAYFTPMSACVKEHFGTMDKFIGDAIMAFWNAPLEVENHAFKALSTAIAMHERLGALNLRLKSEFGVELNIGIGINTGLVHVGNMGSAELLDYTCIGDNVNLASRLEGLCKYYGAGIIISASTAAGCVDKIALKKLDVIRVKGKSEAVEIFTPFTGDSSAWDEAFTLYQKGSFGLAGQAFSALGGEVGARTLCKRSLSLAQNPPQNWDGVWSFESK